MEPLIAVRRALATCAAIAILAGCGGVSNVARTQGMGVMPNAIGTAGTGANEELTTTSGTGNWSCPSGGSVSASGSAAGLHPGAFTVVATFPVHPCPFGGTAYMAGKFEIVSAARTIRGTFSGPANGACAQSGCIVSSNSLKYTAIFTRGGKVRKSLSGGAYGRVWITARGDRVYLSLESME